MKAWFLGFLALLVIVVTVLFWGGRSAVDPVGDPAASRSSPVPANALRAPTSFQDIQDPQERAEALFGEIARVLRHPRCINCHPQAERPLQGDKGRLHEPWVVRASSGLGAPGQYCSTCHGTANYLNVPGGPKWYLAPARSGWVGRSPRKICQQLKDSANHGGRDLDALHEFIASDSFVAYGWNAPEHLSSAPGDQATLAALFRAWIDAGAHCPPG